MGPGQDFKKQNKQVGEISLQGPPRPPPSYVVHNFSHLLDDYMVNLLCVALYNNEGTKDSIYKVLMCFACIHS